jgi:hypothetical protein
MPYKNFWALTYRKEDSKRDGTVYSIWQPQVKLLAKDITGPEVRDYCASMVRDMGGFANDSAE